MPLLRSAACICCTPHLFFPLFSSHFDTSISKTQGSGNLVLNNANAKIVGDVFRYQTCNQASLFFFCFFLFFFAAGRNA